MTVVIQESTAILDLTQQALPSIVINEEENNIVISTSASPSVVVEQATEVVLEYFGNGPQGIPGPGIISGGATGQVLAKTSNTNYDTQWKTLNLGDLSDVNIASKVNGSVLVYDGGSQQFMANSSFTSLSLTDGGNF
jgi:hypothetical protein